MLLPCKSLNAVIEFIIDYDTNHYYSPKKDAWGKNTTQDRILWDEYKLHCQAYEERTSHPITFCEVELLRKMNPDLV